MSRICVIDENFDRPSPPFIQEAFEALGHETATVFSSTRPRVRLQEELEGSRADLFVAIQNVGFLTGDILAVPRLAGVKKAILFYDEPMSSFFLFGKKHPFIRAPQACGAHFFIWDGYWRRKMEAAAGWKSGATHLAAETKHFGPDRREAIAGIRHCAVFLGNVPSAAFMEKAEASLPPLYRNVAAMVRRRIAEGVYGLNPFETMGGVIRDLPSSDREQILGQIESYLDSTPDFTLPLAPHIALRKLAWQIGKRETRLRAMRAAASAAPLAILSDIKHADVAGRDELMHALAGGKGREILFVDTSDASYYQLAHFYRSGLLHLQSTDPQSVEGGIPYRVFQCAACAAPLLSDFKKELAGCFAPDREILLYQDDRDLPDALRKAVANPSRLREIGRAAYERFLSEHTWTHRMGALLKIMGPLN
ncbi:MAG: glycosyltransferase family 1 protein [Verrucomicrobia bacterium]|nr:glycosyltransferase family 1 protein [Verrucomicrobiota bacterium]